MNEALACLNCGIVAVDAAWAAEFNTTDCSRASGRHIWKPLYPPAESGGRLPIVCQMAAIIYAQFDPSDLYDYANAATEAIELYRAVKERLEKEPL